MHQELDPDSGALVGRDSDGIVREVLHVGAPIQTGAATPQVAAARYLDEHGRLIGVGDDQLQHLASAPESAPSREGEELRFEAENRQFDIVTVTYHQAIFGLPVWQAGVAVDLKGEDRRALAARSSRHVDLDVEPPDPAAAASLLQIGAQALAQALLGSDKDEGFAHLEILSSRLVVFRYLRDRRVPRKGLDDADEASVTCSRLPTLELPPVPDEYRSGVHYVAAEVIFVLGSRDIPELRWRAIVALDRRTVLYLDPFVDDVNGLVFSIDPVTTNGSPLPSATSAALNPVRTSVLLEGLVAPTTGPQTLNGPLVALVDSELPTIAAPTEPVGTNFDFDARTNNFAAVNAYYHCDQFFRILQDLGFTPAGYLPGTALPTSVDHRGNNSGPTGAEINAHCLGNGALGILRTAFMLADLGDVANPIGLAADFRVAMHELFGHGILYNHVNSANFGFGAILADAGSLAPVLTPHREGWPGRQPGCAKVDDAADLVITGRSRALGRPSRAGDERRAFSVEQIRCADLHEENELRDDLGAPMPCQSPPAAMLGPMSRRLALGGAYRSTRGRSPQALRMGPSTDVRRRSPVSRHHSAPSKRPEP